MKNKNDKRGKSPANFYDRIAEMLNKAAIPQTITVEAEGVSPETFLATGITKRELYATVAMASLAHAVVTTPPTGGGRLRSDWARRVATQAAELAYYLDEALGVRFEPHVIMGFCKPELSGRCVYLDYDCYWFPTELKSLKPYRK